MKSFYHALSVKRICNYDSERQRLHDSGLNIRKLLFIVKSFDIRHIRMVSWFLLFPSNSLNTVLLGDILLNVIWLSTILLTINLIKVAFLNDNLMNVILLNALQFT